MMTETHKKGIEEHIRKKKRVRIMTIGLALFLVIVVPFAITGIAKALQKTAKITLTAEKAEILLGETIPNLHVDIQDEESDKVVLDKKKQYTAEDLLLDLHRGKGYTLECKADTGKEGTYKVKIKIDKDFRKKLEEDWKGKVALTVVDGSLKVKNPVGTWDGDKFKKYDGEYVTNAFIVSKGKTYYFGEDGTKATGWQTIDNKVYNFGKKGVMKNDGWHTRDGAKYFLGENGAAITGWNKIKDETYYFDRDGKMATGTVQVGLSKCKFDKNGKLVEKKDSKIDPAKPMVALTFDDGPGKRTPELLNQLEKYNAHATFFMLGKKVASNAETVKKMSEIGCELGNHSYDHTNLSKVGAGVVASQVGDTNAKIAEAAGAGATVMRPPYGAISPTLKSNVGMPMILWNIDTLDWKTRNAQATIDTVMSTVKDGDIILMHDIHTESIDAALELVPKLQEAGFQLVTVSELAAAKGVELENGGKYTDFR